MSEQKTLEENSVKITLQGKQLENYIAKLEPLVTEKGNMWNAVKLEIGPNLEFLELQNPQFPFSRNVQILDYCVSISLSLPSSTVYVRVSRVNEINLTCILDLAIYCTSIQFTQSFFALQMSLRRWTQRGPHYFKSSLTWTYCTQINRRDHVNNSYF